MKKFKIIAKGRGKGRKTSSKGIRVVKRKYKLKNGTEVTKIYTYGIRTTSRSTEAITRNGQLTEYGRKYVEALKQGENKAYEHTINAIVQSNPDMTESSLIGRLENIKEQIEAHDLNKKTVRSFIYNMGGDVDTLAADLGISKQELLYEGNWQFRNKEEAVFVYKDNYYSFSFKYDEETITWEKSKTAPSWAQTA